MPKYSVLMLNPLAEGDPRHGVETYMSWTKGEDHTDAIKEARKELSQEVKKGSGAKVKPGEIIVIAWFEGWVPMGVCWNGIRDRLILKPPEEGQ